MNTLATLTLAAALGLAVPARADELVNLDDLAAPLASTNLSLDLAAALAQPPAEAQPETAKSDSSSSRSLAYGRTGSRWWTVGVAGANDFHQNTDLNLHVAYSEFLADELEFAVEAAGWYFHQQGDDTGGISGSMIFRWHFYHADDFHWTIFADAGIGMLGSFSNVPDGGTGFSFLPRIGLGFTRAFNESIDGESRGARWMVGVRYHHISNGRISGDSSNPARDAVCVYAGITFPF